MLKIVTSNRLETLANELARRLESSPLADAAASELVIIPSRGLETWLSMKLSQAMGISANIRFAFPAKEIRKAMTAALAAVDGVAFDPRAPLVDLWDPDPLAWAILQELPGHLADPRFKALAGYLTADEDATPSSGGAAVASKAGVSDTINRKEYTLAQRIANLFDEYAKYRPGWVREWSLADAASHPETLPGVDADNLWQPLLWSAVQKCLGSAHPISRLQEARVALIDPRLAVAGLPQRLTVFGISSLPRVFLDVLSAMSSRLDVMLMALSPVEGYFGDALTRAEKNRHAAANPDHTSEDLHLYNCPLFESMGKLGRDFNEILANDLLDCQAANDHEDLCEDPVESAARPTLLTRLQADLLHLRSPAPEGVPPDHSLQFHACHGALRQVEVLRDEILRLFRDHPDLQPRDVAVLCPDIDAFAPLIDAVFTDGDASQNAGNADSRAGFPEMRFAIADRNARGLNPVAETVSRVLGLVAGRLPASEVMDLLALEPVQRRFDLDADEIALIVRWMGEARARWGLDEDHREEEGQPRDRQNTWRFGLDRLLLGAAMPGDGRRFFAGVLPYDEIEGGTARTLGKFLRLCETIFQTRRLVTKVAGGRTLAGWRELVGEILDTFVRVPESGFWQIRKVREVFGELEAEADAITLTRHIDLDTVRLLLDERLAAQGSTAGLLKGGINFSAMVPMRSIPFRVVCLLGMDDGAFPRQQRRPGFDLISRHPQRGDRDAREDDRYLFLESLISARDAVIVTWNGRGIRDNVELPPAVPVGELLDVTAGYRASEKQPFDVARKKLIQVHPLQAFSPEAFRTGDRRPRSFDRRSCQAARALGGPKERPWQFFDDHVLPPPDEWVVTVSDLAAFFKHPVKHLIRKRLKINLDKPDDIIEDREPVELDKLEDWGLGDALLTALLRGDTIETACERLTLEGRLPPGVLGKSKMDRIGFEARTVWERAKAIDLGRRMPGAVDDRVGHPPVRITGSLDGLRTRGQVEVSFSKVKPKYLLSAWIKHLLACATVPGFSGISWLVGSLNKDKESQLLPTYSFQGVDGEVVSLAERARAELGRLLELYRIGWCQPLLLMPDSSYQYVLAKPKPSDVQDDAPAREKAIKAFVSKQGDRFPKEQDAYWSWVLGDVVPWQRGVDLPVPNTPPDLRPEALALRVWQPLLNSMQQGADAEVAP